MLVFPSNKSEAKTEWSRTVKGHEVAYMLSFDHPSFICVRNPLRLKPKSHWDRSFSDKCRQNKRVAHNSSHRQPEEHDDDERRLGDEGCPSLFYLVTSIM